MSCYYFLGCRLVIFVQYVGLISNRQLGLTKFAPSAGCILCRNNKDLMMPMLVHQRNIT